MTTWRYRFVAAGAEGGFEVPGYDDSGWPQSEGPFGDSAGFGTCGIFSTCPPVVGWPAPADELLVRAVVAGGEFRAAVDDSMTVWVDGVEVYVGGGNQRTGQCAHLWDHAQAISAGVVAVRAHNVVNERYFHGVVESGFGSGFSVGSIAL